VTQARGYGVARLPGRDLEAPQAPDGEEGHAALHPAPFHLGQGADPVQVRLGAHLPAPLDEHDAEPPGAPRRLQIPQHGPVPGLEDPEGEPAFGEEDLPQGEERDQGFGALHGGTS